MIKNRSLFAINSAILIFFLQIIGSHGLKCACNTQRGVAPCSDDICEVDIKKEGEETLTPSCAAVRHPIKGDFFACSHSSKEIGRQCMAERYLGDDGRWLTIEKCWCDTADFCNLNLLIPLEYEEDDDIHESKGGLSVPPGYEKWNRLVTPETSAETPTEVPTEVPTETPEVPTETSKVPVETPKYPPETLTPAIEIPVAELSTEKTSMDPDPDSSQISTLKVETDYENDFAYANEKAQVTTETLNDDEKRQVFSKNIESNTESATTTSEEIISSRAMTKKLELNESAGPLRTDYLKPAATNIRAKSGAAVSASQCADGDCSRNNIGQESAAGGVDANRNWLLCWLLTCIFAIPAMIALERA